MTDMRLVIAGAGGRMGRTLVRLLDETQGLVLAGALERRDSPFVGQDSGRLAGLEPNGIAIDADAGSALARADGVVDFTAPQATVELAALAAERGIVHVIGTTGLSPADDDRIRAAAKTTAIVKSGNMSLGVNLLAALVRRAARTLGEEFDIEVLEMHHRRKVDAPSGTALLLGEAAAAGRGIALSERAQRVRDGHTGARRAGDIGFATLRGGSVVGDHTVIFAGEGERISFSHHAEDRTLFARGALKAALWAMGRPPGLYGMADVLGLGD
jgi:4-hydroxy-tetrahydrodipicolinate reductase